MCVKSGYKSLTPIAVANVLSAQKRKRISHRAVRVYFACLAMVAVREAAARKKATKRQKGRNGVRFRLSEVGVLTGLNEKCVRRELRSLKHEALLEWSEEKIEVATAVLPGSEAMLEALAGKRSPRRPVPFPRSVLRFVASGSEASLSKTMLVYVLRGLSIGAKDGVIKGRGAVKASWVASVLGLTVRSVKAARRKLIELDFISKDTHSFQRKLNRDGAYFEINLEWYGEKRQGYQISPLAGKKTRNFSPPIEDKKTSSEIKNQKTEGVALNASGICRENGKRKPTLRDIRPDDIKDFAALRGLFFQAVKAGWLKNSEASFLNWLAAAVRANSVRVRDPVRVFVSVVRGGRWDFITQAQEERARVILRRHQDSGQDHGQNVFHAHRRAMERVGVTLTMLNL